MEKSAGKLRKIPAISKRNRKISTGNGKKTEGYGSIIPRWAVEKVKVAGQQTEDR